MGSISNCRGSWALGTACGKCGRCLATMPSAPIDAAPKFYPVHKIEGWIAPADLYAAINRLAEMHPDAKHVCWDMLMLCHSLPRTAPPDAKTPAR